MKTSTKNAMITGIIAIICSAISSWGTKEYFTPHQEQAQNQNVVVNVNDQEPKYNAEDIKHLNDENSELIVENTQLKLDNESLESQITTLSAEKNKLFDDINTLKMENEDLRSKISEYQNESSSSQISNDNNDDYRSFLSECTPYYKTNYVYIIENSIKMCGVTYSNGLKFACDGYYALFNLDGKYNKMRFDIGHIDNSAMFYGEVHIYVDKLDSNPAKIIPIDPQGIVQSYEVELNGAQQLKIATVADKKDIMIGIVNIEVK